MPDASVYTQPSHPAHPGGDGWARAPLARPPARPALEPAFRGPGRHRRKWRRGRARKLGLLAVIVLVLAMATADTGPSGYVGRSGAGLTLDGAPFRFAGLNVFNAVSAGATHSGDYCGRPTNLDTASGAFGPGVRVVRVWFFQRLATTPDGRRDWTGFDQLLAAAKRHHLKVIAVLGNQWADCEGYSSAAAGYKDESWYREGYRTIRPPGQPVPYRAWVREVADRYRGDPTIMMWQLVNEPEAAVGLMGRCPDGAASALWNFVDDVSTLIKARDPRHLVSIGTAGNGQCGAVAEEWISLTALPTIDVAEYHDYGLSPLPGDDWNGLRIRLAEAATLGKPLIVGEIGVRAGQVGGIWGRADLIRRKLAAQFQAGASGALLWSWQGQVADGSGPSGYEIGPGDPALSELAQADRAVN